MGSHPASLGGRRMNAHRVYPLTLQLQNATRAYVVTLCDNVRYWITPVALGVSSRIKG